MNTHHIYIASPAQASSNRWRQAFPQGKEVPVQSLAESILKLKSAPSVVWVNSADVQWKQQLELVRKASAAAQTVVVSSQPNPQEGIAALQAGARGYTHAYALPSLLREVATVVIHGGVWAGPDLLQQLVAATAAALSNLPAANPQASDTGSKNAQAWASLSSREAEVALHVAQGQSNREVAEKLFISERTVKAHLGAVFEKLAIRDRLQLVLFAASVQPEGLKAGSSPIVKETSA
jgi:two-component system, NarL family, nitrate/nitrite response regulator NarL